LPDNGACATDGKGAQELLAEFQQTGQQAPFEEIARRYAGMVYNVAYQVTRDAHDAEDATQATFLTLAVHAKTAGKIRYVGPWLRKVSHRLALDIRRSKKRRKAREERHANGNGHAMGNGNGNGNGFGPITEVPVSNGMQMEELRHILREELDKLPSKYRMPLILYYFGGLSPEEMGKELKVNTSTLGVRLHRGRKMLAESLSGRGVSINASIIGALLTGLVDSFVRDNLVHSASHAAVQVAAMGGMPDGTVVSAPIVAMIRSATSAIRLSRFKGIIAAAILVATTLAGAAEVLHRYDLLDSSILEKIDVLRFIRPMMDRLLAPRLTADAAGSGGSDLVPVNTERSSSTPGFVSNFEFSLTPRLSSADDLFTGDLATMTPAQAARVAAASVGSERLMMSQLQPVGIQNNTAAAYVAPPAAITSPKEFQLNTAKAVTAAASAPSVAASVATLAPTTIQPMVVDSMAASGLGETRTLSKGVVSTSQVVIGESGAGEFFHTGGEMRVSQSVVLGENAGSSGTYSISQDAKLTTPNLTIGKSGKGTVKQDGGTVVVANNQRSGTVTIAQDVGSSGKYLLDGGGKLYADNIVVGDRGTASFDQKNGTVATNWANLGKESTGNGAWTVEGGKVQLGDLTAAAVADQFSTPVSTAQSALPPPTPVLEVGRKGSGTLTLHASNPDGAAIQELPGIQGSALVVRSSQTGDGMLRGYGKVNLTGPVVQNGRIIADGFGAKRALDFSSAQLVTNTIDNPAGQHNGWYAQQGGSIVLPSIKITGENAYTWGEEKNDREIDLVNAVRFTPHGSQVTAGNGAISLSLLDPSSIDVAPLPDGRTAVSLWSLDSSIDLSSIDLMVRYDDLAADDAKINEADLGLWVYESGNWQALADASAGVDVDRHLLWATADGTPSYLAASSSGQPALPTSGVPEPSTFALFTMSLTALLVRRRRSKHSA
jgi:RNA polymerase sigma factor (sigma-70 family)